MKAPSQFQLLLAALCIHAIGVEVLLVLPAFVDGLAQHLGFNEREVGRIAAVENAGMASATLALTFLWSRVSWRATCSLGLVLMALGNFLSMATPGFWPMLALRFVTGLGAGALITLSYALAGLTERKERNFGLIVMSGLVYAALVFAILPGALRAFGMNAVFVVFGALPVVCLPLARYFPASRAGQVPAASGELGGVLQLSALAGMIAYSLAVGAIWAYFFRIGSALGVSAAAISKAFSVSQFLAMAGALLAAVLGSRLKMPIALTLGLVGLALPQLILFGQPTTLWFALVVGSFNFFWNFFHPYLLAAFASFGANSRMVIYAAPLLTIGLAAGPAIAASIVVDRNFVPVIALSMSLLALSLALLLPPALNQIREASFAERAI